MHTVLDVRAQCYICLSIVCMCTYMSYSSNCSTHTHMYARSHHGHTQFCVRAWVCARGYVRVCVRVCVCDCYLIDAESFICDL